MLDIVKWVWVFAIGCQLIYQLNILINVLLDRARLTDLKEMTQKKFVLISGKPDKSRAVKSVQDRESS